MEKYDITWGVYKKSFYTILIMLLVLALLNLYAFVKNDFLLNETTIGVAIFLGGGMIVSLILYLLCFVSRIRVYTESLERVSLINRKRYYRFCDIDIRFNGLAIDIISNEGKTIFRISSMMTNASRFIGTFADFTRSHPKPSMDLRSNMITPNFYCRNFGIFFLSYGLVVNLLVAVYAYSDMFDWFSIFTIIFGATISFLGLFALLFYFSYRILIESDRILIGGKKYCPDELTIKSTANTISIYRNYKRVKLLNINLYNNWEILYKIHHERS